MRAAMPALSDNKDWTASTKWIDSTAAVMRKPYLWPLILVAISFINFLIRDSDEIWL